MNKSGVMQREVRTPQVTDYFKPKPTRERDVVCEGPLPPRSQSQAFLVQIPFAMPPDVAPRVKEASSQCLLPFETQVFPMLAENQLVLEQDTFRGRWSCDPNQKDSAEQQRLREAYMKSWRGCGQLGYTLSGKLAVTPLTQIRSDLPLDSPEIAAPKPKPPPRRVGRPRLETPQSQTDLFYLERHRERMCVSPPDLYNNVLISYAHGDRVYLGMTSDVWVGKYTLSVTPADFEQHLNPGYRFPGTEIASSSSGAPPVLPNPATKAQRRLAFLADATGGERVLLTPGTHKQVHILPMTKSGHMSHIP